MQVSVVAPTYNEDHLLDEVLDRLPPALARCTHQTPAVDAGTPDLTWQRVRHHSADDPSVRVIRRTGKRGLASAVLDGMAAAQGDALAVIDGDLQHDESVLPEMVRSVLDEGAQVCVGIRTGEAGTPDGRARSRRWITAVGAAVARRVLPRLRRTGDPLSGFFVVSRSLYEQAAPRAGFNSREYKILWPFLDHEGDLAVTEVGYQFRPRAGGKTKLSGAVLFDDLVNALAMRLGRAVSPVFLKYCIVGGVAISLCVWITWNRLRGYYRPPRVEVSRIPARGG